MKYVEVFDYIGHVGVYQYLLFFTTILFTFFNGLHNLSSNFFAADQEHWCYVPRLENFSFDTQRYVAIPYTDKDDWEDPDQPEYDSCSMYNLDYDSLTDEQILMWNRTTQNYSYTDTMKCTGWVFDQSEFISTINSKYNLVCDDTWMSDFTSTAYMAGLFFGSFLSGMASDKFGRRKTLLVGALCYFVFALVQAFAPNYPAFVIFRFLLAFSTRFAKLSAYVIMIEVLGPKHKEKFLVFGDLTLTMGVLTMTGMAYGIRDVEKLFIAAAVPILCTTPLIWTLPESPRWLIAQNRFEEANKTLKYIAEVNGRKFPDNVQWEKDTTMAKKGTCSDLCQSAPLRSQLAILFLDWFVVALVFYGIAFNPSSFGDLFINSAIYGLVDIPAIIICYFCIKHGGRRWSNFAGFLITGVFSLAVIPVILLSPEREWLMTALSTVGKGSITFTFTIAYVYTSEMFPTPVRHISLGSCSTVARVGSMLSPFLGSTLEEIWRPMPSLIFGSLATFTAMIVTLLPETRGYPIPDSIEAAEKISRMRKRFGRKKAPVVETSVTDHSSLRYRGEKAPAYISDHGNLENGHSTGSLKEKDNLAYMTDYNETVFTIQDSDRL